MSKCAGWDLIPSLVHLWNAGLHRQDAGKGSIVRYWQEPLHWSHDRRNSQCDVIIFLRYTKDGEACTTFCGNHTAAAGDTETVYEKAKEVLEEKKNRSSESDRVGFWWCQCYVWETQWCGCAPPNLVLCDAANVRAYTTMRVSILETLIDNLDNRFPQSGMTILCALGDIFDVKLYPSQNLQQHATVAPETILERYSPDSMDRVLIERNRTRRHFSEIKLRPCQLHAGVQTCDFESIRNLPRLCCACTHLHHHPNQLCSLWKRLQLPELGENSKPITSDRQTHRQSDAHRNRRPWTRSKHGLDQQSSNRVWRTLQSSEMTG